eukprot:1236962-Rhodomonas_salina.1
MASRSLASARTSSGVGARRGAGAGGGSIGRGWGKGRGGNRDGNEKVEVRTTVTGPQRPSETD